MQANNKTEFEANWSLISSDPDVFNDMLRAYNINEVVIQEAYSVTFDELINDSPVYGVIYTSRYDDDEPLPSNIENEEPGSESIIFTSQIVTNACATLALLSILLNTDIDRGQIIDDFASFTTDFSPINRGIALGNSPHIRKIHNSYAVGETRANASIQADTLLTEDDLVDEDSFHFVSYIPKDGYIWELDGLKIRPVKLAAITEGKHWLKTLGPILGQKMSDNDQCNILVAVKNPLIDMKRCLANYTRELESLKDESAAVQLKDQDSQKRRREIHEQTQSPCPKDQLQHNISILYHDINEREIQTQKDMLNMSRLKFDYFPFITQLISKTHQHQIIKLPHPPAEESAPLKITSTPKRRRPSRSSNNPKAPKAPRRPRRSRATKTPETEQIPKDPQVLKDSNDPKDLETQQVPNATDDNQAPPKEDPESPKATKATIAQKTPRPPRKSRRQKQEEQEEEADVIL